MNIHLALLFCTIVAKQSHKMNVNNNYSDSNLVLTTIAIEPVQY